MLTPSGSNASALWTVNPAAAAVSGTNTRTDGYGTDVAGRVRFPIEVATAVAAAIGPDKVGIRISPGHPFNDITETEVRETYDALIRGLAPLGLAYLHVLDTTGYAGYPVLEQARERKIIRPSARYAGPPPPQPVPPLADR